MTAVMKRYKKQPKMSIDVHSDKLNVQVTKQQSVLEELLRRANQLASINGGHQGQSGRLIRPADGAQEFILLDNKTAPETIHAFENKFQQLIDVAYDAEKIPFMHHNLENITLTVAMPISVQPYMMPCAWQR